jgi:hypothetical protein
VTPFGPAWENLTLQALKDFLRDAPAEPLLWECKRELRAASVRKAVCGLSNGHDTGYLILGADPADGEGWRLTPIAFSSDDPPSAITDLLAGGGVTPYPDGLDVREFPADGGHVVVVRVPPVATPPSNVGGTVYERVSGKTIPVTDPARLAALFSRGDAARATAQANAHRAAHANLLAEPSLDAQFSLGLAATAYRPDIASRLFTEQFLAEVRSVIAKTVAFDPLVGGQPVFVVDVAQDSVTIGTNATHRLGWTLRVRSSWDGVIGVYWRIDVERAEPESIVNEPLRAAWKLAERLLEAIGGVGPRYMHLIPVGGLFPSAAQGELQPPELRRGPLAAGVDDSLLASIKREMERSIGRVYALEQAQVS